MVPNDTIITIATLVVLLPVFAIAAGPAIIGLVLHERDQKAKVFYAEIRHLVRRGTVASLPAEDAEAA